MMNPRSQRDMNPNAGQLGGDMRSNKKRGAGASSDMVAKQRRGGHPLTDVRNFDPIKPPMYDLSPSPQRNPGGFIGQVGVGQMYG